MFEDANTVADAVPQEKNVQKAELEIKKTT